MNRNLPFFLFYMACIAGGFAFISLVPLLMLRRVRRERAKADPFKDWNSDLDGEPTWSDLDRMRGTPRR